MSGSGDSPIVAHDDDGEPITEDDLVAESYRYPDSGAGLDLLPPDDFEGDEDEWEDRQLIEAVRARRRAAKVAR